MNIIKEIRNCPFCNKKTINVIITPEHTKYVTSQRGKTRVTRQMRVKENLDPLGGCPSCGKSLKEVKKALSQGTEQKQVMCLFCGKNPPHEGWTICDECEAKRGKKQ